MACDEVRHTAVQPLARTVGGDDFCRNRRQRVHRLRVRSSPGPKAPETQRFSRHLNRFAGRLHALHTAAARRGRRRCRRPLRRDSARQHAAGCAVDPRQGRQRRLRQAHGHIHRPRGARPQPAVGSSHPDAGIGDPAVRRARSGGARPRAEVDGRGAVPARPRARATRTGRRRRRSRPKGGAADDRRRRRIVLGDRTGSSIAGACRFRRQTAGLRRLPTSSSFCWTWPNK